MNLRLTLLRKWDDSTIAMIDDNIQLCYICHPVNGDDPQRPGSYLMDKSLRGASMVNRPD